MKGINWCILLFKGKPTEASKNLKVLKYGEKNTKDFVEGAEALPDTKTDEGGTEDQDEWESCSEDEDDSDGEWIDVHHSSDDEKVGGIL